MHKINIYKGAVGGFIFLPAYGCFIKSTGIQSGWFFTIFFNLSYIYKLSYGFDYVFLVLF